VISSSAVTSRFALVMSLRCDVGPLRRLVMNFVVVSIAVTSRAVTSRAVMSAGRRGDEAGYRKLRSRDAKTQRGAL
jgi:hypothetical protein